MKRIDEQYTGHVSDVRTVVELDPNSPFDRVWQPFIERWADDHLILAYGRHLRGKVDMGDIYCSVSRDGGDTWLYPVPIFDHRTSYGGLSYAYANPVLYRAPGQDIVWCFAMRCYLHYRDSENSELCAAYTADGGYSWVPVTLTNHHASPLITCAAPVQVENRFLLPVHRNSLRRDVMGDQQHFVLESTSLLEWKLAGYIPQPESGPVFMHEGNIAAGDEEGELKIVMRTARAGRTGGALEPPTAYSSVSRDGGRTWSPGRPEPALHNTASKAYFGCDGLRRHLYVYSPGPWRERKALHYTVKRPGQAWSAPAVFYDGDNHNSYPTLLEIAEEPGAFFAVWDSSNVPGVKRQAIRFGRFRIPEAV